MYIRRKVFSLLNVEGEDRYFSTTEFVNLEDSAEQKEFSEGKKVKLKDIESNKGIKRAAITALPTGGGSLLGGYLAKEEADKADEEGASDEEIVKRAKKKGLKMGAAAGAVAGAIGAIGSRNAAPLIIAPALGALGGNCAAGVNTKDRIAKRAIKERDKAGK